MQASVKWTPPTGVLGDLVDAAEVRARAVVAERAALVEAASQRRPGPAFADALSAGTALAVLAEIKRRSPSQGDLAPSLEAGAQAFAFARGGAAAVSVLTEPTRFGGSLTDLDAARPAGLPMLRKDFIVHEIQLLEAAARGASAVLLIVRALPPAKLAELHSAARALGLDVLVEVHDFYELELVIDAGYPVVGVNNRNLESLVIDVATAAALVPQIPADRIAVYESGIHGRADAARAAMTGADAILVGTSLSRGGDAEAGVRELTGIERQTRVA